MSISIKFKGTPAQNVANFNKLVEALTGRPVKGTDEQTDSTDQIRIAPVRD